MTDEKESKKHEKKAEHKTDHRKKTEKTETEHLKEQLKDRQNKIDELTETAKRVQAEFENYKKRVDQEKKTFCDYASADIMLKLLPVIDNLELALKNKENKDEFAKGMQMIYDQLMKTLEKEGLKPIHAMNQKFDPYKHEAVLRDEKNKDPEKKDIVVEEMQKGYTFREKVIRHSKVKVG